ncbi:hypothetical protein AGMMS49545_10640 [Betaproteobacteria bacterium]|nr:hypothetical protein AGMMS49545_10640 [Betaproteobacteria bacterium]GHU46712.1 hypothetical protein AGMMS50289_20720 [Betaproteobacteria bacterium]
MFQFNFRSLINLIYHNPRKSDCEFDIHNPLDIYLRQICLLSEQEKDAITQFKANPMSCFINPYLNTPIMCSDDINNIVYFRDIRVRSGQFGIGFFEGIAVNTQEKIATIRHIAVEKKLTGRGWGYVIAYALRDILVTHYKIKTIFFEENSSEFEKSNYPRFFSRLGATKIPGRVVYHRENGKNERERETWEWDLTGC